MNENRGNAPYRSPQSPNGPRPVSGRLWIWFVVGLVATFVAVALFAKVYVMHPSGQAVVQCRLAAYYLEEIRRQFSWTTLGPASSNGSLLFKNLFFHLALSGLGGAGLAGVGWLMRRIRRQKAGAGK
jgi:hypothetical protein